MTQTELKAEVLARPEVLKEVSDTTVRTDGGIELHELKVYFEEDTNARNVYNVYYMLDTSNGEAVYQTADELGKITSGKDARTRRDRLIKRLDDNYYAYSITTYHHSDDFIIADAYRTDGTKVTVIVKKPAGSPIEVKEV